MSNTLRLVSKPPCFVSFRRPNDPLENDNLREEYSNLFADVPQDIPFARIALEKEADAINMWIGNERSVTSLHKDNYENIYVQIRGRKHFVLLPPVEMPCVNEQHLPQARYEPANGLDQNAEGNLAIHITGEELLPVPAWDPEDPETRSTPYSHLSKPLRVSLNEGDILYLPAMYAFTPFCLICESNVNYTNYLRWFHKVSQSSGEEGFACSVNYWYDMDFSGGFWTHSSLLRDITNASIRAVQYPRLEVDAGR